MNSREPLSPETRESIVRAVRWPPAEVDRLDRTAEDLGVNRSDIVRGAVALALEPMISNPDPDDDDRG